MIELVWDGLLLIIHERRDGSLPLFPLCSLSTAREQSAAAAAATIAERNKFS